MARTDLVPDEYAEMHDAAVRMLEEPKLASAVSRLLADDGLAQKLSENPSAVNDLLGIDVPKGLEVRVVGLGKPGPGWVPFTIRMTGCRHYWLRGDDGYEKVEICLGIEIVPTPIPGGPWG